MFGLILTLVASLMHGYLTWRIATLQWFRRPGRRPRLLGGSLLLWLLYIVGVMLRHDAGALLWLDRLALDWLGILFIATTVLLAVDLVTGFGLWAGRYRDRLRIGALLLAVVMIIVALVQGGRAPQVVRHEVALEGLPAQLDGTRLLVLADLHLGSQLGREWLAARVTQVEALKPDLILLLGDIFEGHGAPDPALQPLFARLQAPLGVYAVTGNHEFHGDTTAAIAMSEAAGVVWLRDRTLEVAPGLVLVGVDDLTHGLQGGESVDRVTPLLHKAVTVKGGAPLLLSHSPLQVEAASAAGAGLMLSAHTHGGQIWPFGYLVARRYPYLAGRYRVGGMTLIVSRGTGLWGPRLRLWRPGEIVEVTLRAAE